MAQVRLILTIDYACDSEEVNGIVAKLTASGKIKILNQLTLPPDPPLPPNEIMPEAQAKAFFSRADYDPNKPGS